jgi:hypothetical protein
MRRAISGQSFAGNWWNEEYGAAIGREKML